MAATYSLDIEKTYAGIFWTNRYLLSSPSIESAIVSAAAVINAERDIHATGITLSRFRVSDLDPDTDVFVINPIGQAGNRSISSILPMFNVVRVDFPAGLGRPCRKYLRVGISEDDSVNGALSSGLVAAINADYCGVLDDVDALCDPDGEPLGTGVVYPNIAMRQLRRGSKRRTTPVL